jgi:predicted DNA binding protein
MQYAQMVDLIEKAKLAGAGETESVRDALASTFETWLNQQDLREITDEEVEALQTAFAEGFTNYYKA